MKNHAGPSDKRTDNFCVSEEINKEILSHIPGIRENLKQISVWTEQGFVTLGNTLQKAHEEGAVVARKASDIVALSEGDMGKRVLVKTKDLIRHSLEHLKKQRETIVTSSFSVENVMGHLRELKKKNTDIERLAKYLRAVALNIFIETSRSHAVSDNFSIIAGEIKQLSETILSLAKSMRENVDESGKRFGFIHQEIQTGMGQLEQLTHDADKSFTDAVKKTDSWVAQAGKTAVQTANIHKTIMVQVGEIVMSLQFHDAMRQRLEHIGTGLGDMLTMYEDPDDNDEEKVRENMAMVHALAGLLSDQLEQIIREIYENHERCSNAFDSMGQFMNQVEQDARKLSGQGADKGFGKNKALDTNVQLQESLSGFMALQAKGGELVKRMDEAYTMASQTSESLSKQVDKIHQISMDAHIKALNAIIAATHLGYEGKTLSVLAEEMKVLSDLTDVFVRDVGDIITHMVSDSDLEGSMTGNADENDQALNDMLRKVPVMIDQIKKETGELQKTMDLIHETHETAIQNLGFMTIMADDLEVQNRLLINIKERLSPFEVKGRKIEKIHALLEERFTMEKERTVHKSSLGLTGEPKKSMVDQEDDLGDNIELF
ncbi:MAG: methyl-accepting chemotaxis protein [Proteobacteria bacterium]|nr:methyl-accepting chemotaxis protein [Pseudomonadota bacterium]